MGNLSSTLKKRSRSTSPCCLARNSSDSSKKDVAAVAAVPTTSRFIAGGDVSGSVSSLLKAPTCSKNLSITVSRSSTLDRRSKNNSNTNLTDDKQNRHENATCYSKNGLIAIQRSKTRASFYNDKRRQTLASSAVTIESPYNQLRNFHCLADDIFHSRRSCLSEPSTPIILSARQKLAIVKSWHQWSYAYKYSHTSRENVGVKIYLKLFSKSQVYKIVYGFDSKIREDQFLINHKFIGFVKVLNNSLENAVQHLDSLQDTVNHLDGLGEAILECLLEAQGAHKHRDTATAWRIFVSWFVDVLKEGFQDSVRQNRRATLPVALWATTTAAESSTSSSSIDDLKRAAMISSSNSHRSSLVGEKLIFIVSVSHLLAIPIDNGVISSSVECMEDTIILTFNTKKPFRGRIFVKGMSDRPECSKSFASASSDNQDSGTKSNGSAVSPDITFNFGSCNMHKVRMVSPQPGMMQSLVAIISFHKLFITKIDKAYKVQCFYMEAENIVTSNFEVSMLSTDEVRDSGRMPVCTYQVRRESRTGAIVKYAKVGEPVFHTWECDGSSYKLLVKNCFVDDGQGTRYQILDDKGCVVDKYILPGIQYDNSDPSKAWVEAHVFKYADRPTVYFQCAVLVCNKNEKSCDGITPPKCPGISGSEAVSGTTISTWPANNSNRGVYTSTAEKAAPSEKSAQSAYPSQLRIIRDFTVENGGSFQRRRRQILMDGKSTESDSTTINQIIKVKTQNDDEQHKKSYKNHKEPRSATDSAEVDLVSDAITVIEIDDSATLKNGKNDVMDAKTTSSKMQDYVFSSSDQLPDRSQNRINGNDNEKAVCMSSSTLGVLISFVLFIFSSSLFLSIVMCKMDRRKLERRRLFDRRKSPTGRSDDRNSKKNDSSFTDSFKS